MIWRGHRWVYYKFQIEGGKGSTLNSDCKSGAIRFWQAICLCNALPKGITQSIPCAWSVLVWNPFPTVYWCPGLILSIHQKPPCCITGYMPSLTSFCRVGIMSVMRRNIKQWGLGETIVMIYHSVCRCPPYLVSSCKSLNSALSRQAVESECIRICPIHVI